MNYTKKYIFSLHPPILSQSSYNPWNFLCDESVLCYINKMTFGMPLGDLQIRASHPEELTMRLDG